MVLCPTTILAEQHYETFFSRFAPFDLKVAVLSRFVTPAQQRKTLEGFADGSVNVLIGTHRLLSADVNPYDLGLVIIDEEQRFGVQHKEQLKNMSDLEAAAAGDAGALAQIETSADVMALMTRLRRDWGFRYPEEMEG